MTVVDKEVAKISKAEGGMKSGKAGSREVWKCPGEAAAEFLN